MRRDALFASGWLAGWLDCVPRPESSLAGHGWQLADNFGPLLSWWESLGIVAGGREPWDGAKQSVCWDGPS